MPSTFAHALVPASCLLASRTSLPPLTPKKWCLLYVLAMFLGNAPDLDLIPACLFPTQFMDIHREWGHNIFALVIWISLGKLLLSRFISLQFSSTLGWGISTALVLSHIVLDAMGDYNHYGIRYGVPVLWPLSEWELILPITLFKPLQLNTELHPLMAHITSRQFWQEAFLKEVLTIILFPLGWATVHYIFTHSRISILRKLRVKSKKTSLNLDS